MAGSGLTREFIAERDAQIFALRKGGTAPEAIARRFEISVKAVHTAIKRYLERMNREALLAFPEVLRMELERLDAMQAALWPQTQVRRVTLPDGTETTVDPDPRATAEVRNIMQMRAKLLGLETVQVQQPQVQEAPQRAVLAEATPIEAGADDVDPKAEALRLIELMGSSRIMDPALLAAALGTAPAGEIGTGTPQEDVTDGNEVLVPDDVF